MRAAFAAIVAMGLAAVGAQAVELRGHGGPVRALALAPDGRALTGSFDSTAIVWDAGSGAARTVLRLHAGSVNAVAFLPDGGFATGGQDGVIGLWRSGRTTPDAAILAHAGPIAALAVSPDGRRLASAGWDGGLRLSDLPDGGGILVATDAGPLNGVGFLPGGGVATAGYDGAVRFWAADGAAGRTIASGAPLNALAVAPDGGIWTAGADGILRLLGPAIDARAEIAAGAAPLVSLALAGRTLAAGGLDGKVTLVDAVDRRILRVLEASAGPVWSLAFDGDILFVAGSDNVVRAWSVATGASLSGAEAPPQDDGDGSRGAAVFRACAACHTLDPSDGARAGPTLHGLFGRRVATAAGYDFSSALVAMDIVWTRETISDLFDLGPSRFTPGTKMPEQRIPNPADRMALIDFLETATR